MNFKSPLPQVYCVTHGYMIHIYIRPISSFCTAALYYVERIIKWIAALAADVPKLIF